MAEPYAFVTVGTTNFDALIDEVLTPAALKSIHKRGISRLLLQVGRGREENARAASQRDPSCKENGGVKIEYYRFKDSLLEDLKNAELVISHAGSGTLLEALGARKKVIVVVNESLMDNHQVELARQLGDMGCLVYSTPRTLLQALEDGNNTQKLNEWPPANPSAFAEFLDAKMGFSPAAKS